MSRNPIVWIAAAVLLLFGLVNIAAGAWLAALGGSWYYLIAGIVFFFVAALLLARRSEALGLFAVLVLATLVWALWEVGFDWWPLAARGDLVFLLGLLLLVPAVVASLDPPNVAEAMDKNSRPAARRRFYAGGLAAALALVMAVAIVSWFTDLHAVEGRVPEVATAAAAAAPEDGPDGEWHAYGRTGFGQRFSPLSEITPKNVADLEEAWTFHTGETRQPSDPVEMTFEVTPLKIGDRLFFCTPHQQIIALDADTGALVWKVDPKIQGQLALQHLTCRGLSYHPPRAAGAAAPGVAASPAPADAADPALPTATEGAPSGDCDAKLFMATADGRIIALAPEDGRICGNFGGGTGQIDLWRNMPNVSPGSYYSTSPVVVTDRAIVVGGTVLDNVSVDEASGVIRAFDIDTGALLWNFDSGNPDATAPIADGQHYTANSPNSWSILSVDAALGLVYVPMGNQPPDQWGANRSPAVERFSSSVIALDLATGKVRWVFQTVHHDLWDYDVPAQPSLVDLVVKGETVPALVQPTKQGEIFVLDRRSGAPILPVIELPAPGGAQPPDHASPTQPVSSLSFDPPPLVEKDMWGATMFDELACRIALKRLRYDGRFTPPSLQGSLIYPGNFGVFNWGGVAVDPARRIAFTTPTTLAFVSQLVPRFDDKTLYVQDAGKPKGALPALNENFGAPYAVQLKPFTSLIGLPCQSPPWGYVAAADLATGKVFWKHKNGTVRDSSPLPLPFRMGVPNLGGPIMTAGGLAFLSGTLDDYLRAYDVSTGEELWKGRLPAGGQATPMTYAGRDGSQYVLAVAGGHGSLGTKAGDALVAFRLRKP